MRKLTVLAVMLAMVLLAVAPAAAQEVSQEVGQEADSGSVSLDFSVTSTGDYAGQCAVPQQFGQSGNLQNGQGAVQNDADADDIEVGGSSISVSPELAAECEQKVQQSAAASAAPKAEQPKAAEAKATPPAAPKPTPPAAPKAETPKATPPPAPKAEQPKAAEAKAGAVEAKTTPKAKAEQPKAAAQSKELPKTGGGVGASLLTLGVGALLVGGGLVIRKISR